MTSNQIGMGQAHHETINPVFRGTSCNRILAFVQIMMAGCLLLLDAINLAMDLHRSDIIVSSSAGLWSGTLFLITGLVGYVAARPVDEKTPRQFAMTASLLLSILSSSQCLGMFLARLTSMPIIGQVHGQVAENTTCGPDCQFYLRYGTAIVTLHVMGLCLYFVLFPIFIATAFLSCIRACRAKHQLIPRRPRISHGSQSFLRSTCDNGQESASAMDDQDKTVDSVGQGFADKEVKKSCLLI